MPRNIPRNLPRKPLRSMSKNEREERARQRAEEGALATAEYHAAAQATIARIAVLRRKRLAQEARVKAREGARRTVAPDQRAQAR
jgi:hypothetical protein